MKILNLYAGIGGNRKLWGDEHEITAVELDVGTSKVYKSYFPHDEVIIGDAHNYLLENFERYDIIWSSPPCPTHSRLNTTKVGLGNRPEYPLMTLYEEIILLNHWFKGKYIVENVIPYYEPLIPGRKIDRHLFWMNFKVPNFDKTRPFKMDTASISDYEKFLGFDLSSFKLENKRKNLRNCVNPETGKHILDCALGTFRHQSNQLSFL